MTLAGFLLVVAITGVFYGVHVIHHHPPARAWWNRAMGLHDDGTEHDWRWASVSRVWWCPKCPATKASRR